MGGNVGGGVKASAGSQSGTNTETIDAETKAFRDKLFNQYGDLTKNIPGFGGDNSATFIGAESPDTKAFYDRVRSMQGQGSATQNGITAFGNDLMKTGGSLQVPQLTTASFNPAYLSDFGGYQAAQAGQVGAARDLTGAVQASPYQTGYLTDVINPSLNEFDYKAGVGLNNLRMGRGADTAFGNRASNADAVYAAQSDRDRALLASGLRKDAFTTAAGLGMSDADRLAMNDRQKQQLDASRIEANAGRTDAASQYAKNQQYAINQGNQAINSQAQQFNINNNANDQRFNVGNFLDTQNQSIANQFNGANLASGADSTAFQRQLALLGLGQQSGAQQDARSQNIAAEPLNLLNMAASIIGGVPYGGTTTSSGKSKSKSGSVTG